MAIDMNKLVRLGSLNTLAEKADTKIREVETKANAAFKGAKVVNGNTIALYTTTDTTGEPDFTFDVPAEMVVDSTQTGFIADFEFDSNTYVGATDPELDGEAVLVLAIKTIDKGVTTTSYSFISVNSLIDIYVASDTSVVISDYQVKVNVSVDSDNMLATTANGLYVDGSGKMDKVSGATEGVVATFDSDGTVTDSGHAIATDEEITELLDGFFR